MARFPLGVALRYVALVAITFLTVGPFLWLLVTALKSGSENIFAFPPQLVPQHPTLANFQAVWHAVPFGRYIVNSTIVAALSVVLNLVFSSLAAYPLARMRFAGRDAFFYAILATMMVPFPVLMIPLFVLVSKLNAGLADFGGPFAAAGWTYAWLVLPSSVSAFGIFLLRQAFLAVPRELEEAVLIDGGSALDVWSQVLVPLSRPALATLAIFTFVGAWGDFLWPLIVLKDPDLFTLPVGVAYLAGTFSADWRLIAAGAVLSVVPIVVVFTALQRHFVGGAVEGAVKG